MKAVLEFNLPEDKDDFELASHALKLYCAITDIDNVARDVLKYGKDATDALEEIRNIAGIVHEMDIR